MTIGYLWFSIGHLRFPWVAKGTPGAPPKSRPPCAARGHLCGILYQLGWPTSGYPRSPMVTYGHLWSPMVTYGHLWVPQVQPQVQPQVRHGRVNVSAVTHHCVSLDTPISTPNVTHSIFQNVLASRPDHGIL